MLGASRALFERWIFIIADLQLAIVLPVETGPIDRVNGAPCSDRRRSAAVDPRVIIRNLVDDITRAEARLIPSGLAATRDPRRHGGVGTGLILAAGQRGVDGVRHDHPHDDRFLGKVPSGNGAGLRAERINQHRTNPSRRLGENSSIGVDRGRGRFRISEPQKCPAIAIATVEISRKGLFGVGGNEVPVVGAGRCWKLSRRATKRLITAVIARGTGAAPLLIFQILDGNGGGRKRSRDFDHMGISIIVVPNEIEDAWLERIPFFTDAIPLVALAGSTGRILPDGSLRLRDGLGAARLQIHTAIGQIRDQLHIGASQRSGIQTIANGHIRPVGGLGVLKADATGRLNRFESVLTRGNARKVTIIQSIQRDDAELIQGRLDARQGVTSIRRAIPRSESEVLAFGQQEIQRCNRTGTGCRRGDTRRRDSGGSCKWKHGHGRQCRSRDIQRSHIHMHVELRLRAPVDTTPVTHHPLQRRSNAGLGSGRKTHRIEVKPRKNCCYHLLAAGPIAELRTKALRKERHSIALGRQYSHVP